MKNGGATSRRDVFYSDAELRESRFFLNKKVPAFGWITTFLTTCLVIGSLIWSFAVKKTYIVKASGSLIDPYKENIMNVSTGQVSKVYFSEGDRVREGDVVISLMSKELNAQIEQLQANEKYFLSKINNYSLLIRFINGFELDKPESMLNPFDSENLDVAYLYGLADSFIDYAKQNEGTEVGEENSRHIFNQQDLDNIKFTFISQQNIYATLENYQKEHVNISSQLEAFKESASGLLIKAPKDGILHLSEGLLEGTYLSQSILLGSISDDDVSNFVFEVLIQTSERSKVNVDDYVEIGLSGVSQYEYGVVKGKLITISNDVSYSQDGKQAYYIGKVKPDKTYLEDKKGNRINIKLGMTSECRIKYDESTYFDYLLEQLGARLR